MTLTTDMTIFNCLPSLASFSRATVRQDRSGPPRLTHACTLFRLNLGWVGPNRGIVAVLLLQTGCPTTSVKVLKDEVPKLKLWDLLEDYLHVMY